MGKKIREDKLYEIDPSGSLDMLIEQLVFLRNKYREQGYTDLRLVYWGHENPDFDLYGKRLETDSQYNKRIQEEEVKKNKQLAKERKQYERLRKKFKELQIEEA